MLISEDGCFQLFFVSILRSRNEGTRIVRSTRFVVLFSSAKWLSTRVQKHFRAIGCEYLQKSFIQGEGEGASGPDPGRKDEFHDAGLPPSQRPANRPGSNARWQGGSGRSYRGQSWPFRIVAWPERRSGLWCAHAVWHQNPPLLTRAKIRSLFGFGKTGAVG